MVGRNLQLETKLYSVQRGPGEPEDFVRRVNKLFEPLGYRVQCRVSETHADLTLISEDKPLRTVLQQVYLLVSVMDTSKHYYTSKEEVQKLKDKGSEWLPGHPSVRKIVSRYLRKNPKLARDLLEEWDCPEDKNSDGSAIAENESGIAVLDSKSNSEPDEKDLVVAKDGLLDTESDQGDDNETPSWTPDEPFRPLQELRVEALVERIQNAPAAGKILDMGCGWGDLIEGLLQNVPDVQIVGTDTNPRSLGAAGRKIKNSGHPDRARLIPGSAIYPDARYKEAGPFGTIVLSEVIEHFEPRILDLVLDNVFGFLAPDRVLVTTPNREFNVLFRGLEPGKLRNRDHKFEMTREEFANWIQSVAEQYGYTGTVWPIGSVHPEHGPPTQMVEWVRNPTEA